MSEPRGGGRGKRGGRGGRPRKEKAHKVTTVAEAVAVDTPAQPQETISESDIPMDTEVEIGKSDDPKEPGDPEDEEEIFLTAVVPEVRDVNMDDPEASAFLPGDTVRTFIFKDEGHTLGNALRCVITHYPEVLFCGHTIPHPAENEMHLRIQTSGVPAIEILKKGLTDLVEVCDHTETMFTTLTEAFKEANPECLIEIPEPTLKSILGDRY